MPLNAMEYFPLESAYLCQDCNCIGNCANQCPACASTALMGLSVVLNRKMDSQVALQTAIHWHPALVAA